MTRCLVDPVAVVAVGDLVAVVGDRLTDLAAVELETAIGDLANLAEVVAADLDSCLAYLLTLMTQKEYMRMAL
jgi:hypothetical protein